MGAPDPVVYRLLTELLQCVLGCVRQHSLRAVAEVVWALLAAQSLHPADLGRALPDLRTGRARQAYRRVRRLLGRPLLRSRCLTPLLIQHTLQLVPAAAGEVTLVLDSTRCGRWEIFTVSVLYAGRVLPVAWSVLPYPWPKKQFPPTVVALLERVWAHWPPERPAHLVADRGFPSLPFFRCLEAARRQRGLLLGYTIRLRASDWVRGADNHAVKVGDLERAVATGQWTVRPASYLTRGQAGPQASLIIGRGAPVHPAHQRGPADQARRQKRAARRLAHVLSKGQPLAPTTDDVWVLLSVETPATETAGIERAVAERAVAERAVTRYSRRFRTEPTYRDLKSWDLAAVANHETDPTHLDGLVGLAALGYLVQVALGAASGCTEDPSARARQQQWCTTDRLSSFWRGRQVLQDRAHDWRPWLRTALPALRATLASAAPGTAPGTAPGVAPGVGATPLPTRPTRLHRIQTEEAA